MYLLNFPLHRLHINQRSNTTMYETKNRFFISCTNVCCVQIELSLKITILIYITLIFNYCMESAASKINIEGCNLVSRAYTLRRRGHISTIT